MWEKKKLYLHKNVSHSDTDYWTCQWERGEEIIFMRQKSNYSLQLATVEAKEGL
jgi:hypothetical protein